VDKKSETHRQANEISNDKRKMAGKEEEVEEASKP